MRVLQGARHLPGRRALKRAHDLDVQPARRDRLRPDGRLVRAGAQERRAGAAGHRLQQVAVDHRAAKRLGFIDTAAESALLAVSGSDIVLIAVPVSATEATFKAIRHLVEPGVLMMDVGSTKRDVVDAARRVLKDRIGSFVPAHPIAGEEVSGIAHADASLYPAAR